MPTLLALIVDDGFAMVREAGTVYFARPPFRLEERLAVTEATLSDAVSLHGYEAQPGAPDETWPEVVDRIHGLMTKAGEGKAMPAGELLARLLKSAPLRALFRGRCLP